MPLYNHPAKKSNRMLEDFTAAAQLPPAGCSKSSSNKAAGESKPEAYPQGYVEDFDESRTPLAAFFSILLKCFDPVRQEPWLRILIENLLRALPLFVGRQGRQIFSLERRFGRRN